MALLVHSDVKAFLTAPGTVFAEFRSGAELQGRREINRHFRADKLNLHFIVSNFETLCYSTRLFCQFANRRQIFKQRTAEFCGQASYSACYIFTDASTEEIVVDVCEDRDIQTVGIVITAFEFLLIARAYTAVNIKILHQFGGAELLLLILGEHRSP